MVAQGRGVKNRGVFPAAATDGLTAARNMTFVTTPITSSLLQLKHSLPDAIDVRNFAGIVAQHSSGTTRMWRTAECHITRRGVQYTGRPAAGPERDIDSAPRSSPIKIPPHL